jgi:hypothetical protein
MKLPCCSPRTPAGFDFQRQLLPGVARSARSPLANILTLLLPHLRRGERSPEGCWDISPVWSEATRGVKAFRRNSHRQRPPLQL